MPKNGNNKKCQKISPKKIKICQKIFEKNQKMQKTAESAWLAWQPKIRTNIVRIYCRLTSTKSVLRLTCTRLARAEILKSLVGLVERRVKKRKSSAFEAELEFAVGGSVGSLREPPDPKTGLASNNPKCALI